MDLSCLWLLNLSAAASQGGALRRLEGKCTLPCFMKAQRGDGGGDWREITKSRRVSGEGSAQLEAELNSNVHTRSLQATARQVKAQVFRMLWANKEIWSGQTCTCNMKPNMCPLPHLSPYKLRNHQELCRQGLRSTFMCGRRESLRLHHINQVWSLPLLRKPSLCNTFTLLPYL